MSGLFGSPSAPPIPPPTPMPMANDEQMLRAKRNAIAAAQQRGGRASTILTEDKGEKLG